MLACGATDVGQQRPVNEDTFCVEPELGLLAVADGLGGHAAGEIASHLAIATLTGYLQEHLQSTAGGTTLDLLAAAVQAGHSTIRTQALATPQYQGMGTTLTACLVKDGMAAFAHVGDSRAYRLRHGRLTLLTQDHTVAGLRRLHGRGAGGGLGSAADKRLLAALGTSPWIGMDLFTQELQTGDLLLLCTDGLTAAATDAELMAVEQMQLPLAERCAWLLALANARGGADNITVVLALILASD